MIRLSAKTRYGIAAALELAQEYGNGFVGLRIIAKRRGIPLKFLEQIAVDMAKAGLLTAARGSEGGYQLAAPPYAITLSQLMDVLDIGTRHSDAPLDPIVAQIFQKAEEGLKKNFEVSLSDLAARSKGQALTYQI